MRCLIELMEDAASPPAVRIACAVQILDRSLGRAKQMVEVEGGQQRSLEDILRSIAAARDAEAQECSKQAG
jgi:hypothetical protein